MHGEHGILGMRLGDLDRRSGTIVVRLKGARDEHRVPVSDDFWPVFARYLGQERGLGEPGGSGVGDVPPRPRKPADLFRRLSSSLRHLCRKVGVHVTAHMFRHALAQAVVDVAGLKVAQEMLGHAHISTTADTYSHVDEQAMVAAVERARDLFDLRAGDEARRRHAGGYVFPYDPATLAELDAAADSGLGEEPAAVSSPWAFPELADRRYDGEVLLAVLEPLVDRLVMDRANQSKMRLSMRELTRGVGRSAGRRRCRSDGRRLSGGCGRIGCAASAALLTIAGRSGCAR